jgi:hypothetical protein
MCWKGTGDQVSLMGYRQRDGDRCWRCPILNVGQLKVECTRGQLTKPEYLCALLWGYTVRE